MRFALKTLFLHDRRSPHAGSGFPVRRAVSVRNAASRLNARLTSSWCHCTTFLVSVKLSSSWHRCAVKEILYAVWFALFYRGFYGWRLQPGKGRLPIAGIALTDGAGIRAWRDQVEGTIWVLEEWDSVLTDLRGATPSSSVQECASTSSQAK